MGQDEKAWRRLAGLEAMADDQYDDEQALLADIEDRSPEVEMNIALTQALIELEDASASWERTGKRSFVQRRRIALAKENIRAALDLSAED